MAFETHYFRSTAINHATYDSVTQNLTITFKNGRMSYTYYRVPMLVWVRFISATSAGTYFNDYIEPHYSRR